MKPKFEIGDRVIYKPLNYVGGINGINRDTNVYSILYDDGEECCVHEDDLEFVNPKAAFLTRLQELLATFDAEIGVCLDYTATEEAMVLLNGKIVAAGRTITAENVFDYDTD